MYLQDYLAFDDTGSGMTLETLQKWAKLANAPREFLSESAQQPPMPQDGA